uniref:Activating molecule in BECN1-regulated autophagy protein 1 isoform X2 n=1 Tax=Elaeis guineensis var. tenera TaxID=51953 RepID=A0A8N4F035_ELAGV|nr:activating molecule in BECN1-regulated autophagy protein 1 isoform X2 [Elaeis guineensis]
MSQPWVDDAKFSAFTSSSSSHPAFSQSSLYSSLSCSHRNVYRLLALREISPRAKCYSKRLWGEATKGRADCLELRCETIDARRALISWVEAESLRHLSAKYCPLLPPPRSTIAAAFSSDGKTLASTHGDHTVKIIDCHTGNCLKVLTGHRRTPWVALSL